MRNAEGDKTQVNVKLWQETVGILQKVQGYSMLTGKKESQSEVIDRLLRDEWKRIQEKLGMEKIPA